MGAHAESEFQMSLQRNSPRKRSPRKVSLRTQAQKRKPSRFKFKAGGFSLFWGNTRNTPKCSGKSPDLPVNQDALREMFAKPVPDTPLRSRRFAKVFSGKFILANRLERF